MALFLRLKDGGPAKAGSLPTEKDPLQPDTTNTAATDPNSPSAGNGRKILVVDDNPVVLKAFEIKLKASGFNVATTGNGASVARVAEQEMPDLIILDINFPGGGAMEWSGFSIMQWLGRFPELNKIPVILITGAEVAQYQNKAREAGAIALFQKPVNYQELLAKILQALGDGSKPAATPAS